MFSQMIIDVKLPDTPIYVENIIYRNTPDFSKFIAIILEV